MPVDHPVDQPVEQPVDQKRVLFFFENHSDYATPLALEKLVPLLRALGFTVFATEDDRSSFDDVIDFFNRDIKSTEVVCRQYYEFKLSGEDISQEQENKVAQYTRDTHYLSRRLLPLFKKMQEYGFDYCGVDVKIAEDESDKRTIEACARMNERDQYMEKNIHSLLDRSQNGVIFLGGILHFKYFADSGLASAINTFYLYTNFDNYDGVAQEICKMSPENVICMNSPDAMNLLIAQLHKFFLPLHSFVKIYGLKKSCEHNGKYAEVVGVLDERLKVRLHAGGQIISPRFVNCLPAELDRRLALILEPVFRRYLDEKKSAQVKEVASFRKEVENLKATGLFSAPNIEGSKLESVILNTVCLKSLNLNS